MSLKVLNNSQTSVQKNKEERNSVVAFSEFVLVVGSGMSDSEVLAGVLLTVYL